MITFTGDNGLFTRLQDTVAIIDQVNQFQNVENRINYLADEYTSSDREIIDGIWSAFRSHQASMLGLSGYLAGAAADLIIETVKDDNPQPDLSLDTAMVELIAQMEEQEHYVDECITSSTVAMSGGNNSDANVVVCLKSNRGKELQNIFAEDIVLTITDDAQEGGNATADHEPWSASSEYNSTSPLNYLWPEGSASSASGNCIDAESNNSNGNILTNSSFNGFGGTDTGASSQVDNWVYEVGEGEISQGATDNYCVSGNFLRIDSDGATLVAISQTFDTSNGTPGNLEPLTTYAWNIWLATDTALTTGVLAVELVGDDEVLADEEGFANQALIDLTSLTANDPCAAVGGCFYTPRVMPTVLKIRLRFTVAPDNGASIVLDHLALGEATELYTHGPSMAVFTGGASNIREDFWEITITNDRAGRWNAYFDRMFDMNGMRLQLPTPLAATAVTIPEPDLAACTCEGGT